MKYNSVELIGRNVCETCGIESNCSTGGVWSEQFRSHRIAYWCDKHYDGPQIKACKNKKGHKKWGCSGIRHAKNDLIELNARKLIK